MFWVFWILHNKGGEVFILLGRRDSGVVPASHVDTNWTQRTGSVLNPDVVAEQKNYLVCGSAQTAAASG